MTGGDFQIPRRSQPEELAFMFMKVMDEISKASKKTKKISKQQSTTHRKTDANTMGTENTEMNAKE